MIETPQDPEKSNETLADIFNKAEQNTKSTEKDPSGNDPDTQESSAHGTDRNFSSDKVNPDPKPASSKSPYHIPIVEELYSKNYHPILIFGTPTSGKSVLILSLLAYLNFELDSPGNCHFGEEIFSAEHLAGFKDWRDKNNNSAKKIYENSVPDFFYGKLPEHTDLENPVFIPVEFVPTNGEKAFKFALMESQGEHYQVDPSNNIGSRNIPEIIQRLYEGYKRGLSIIYVAPYLTGFKSDEIDKIYKERRKCDQSIYDCISNYNKIRRLECRSRDRFLFVLSKWDGLLKKGDTDNRFVEIDDLGLSREIHARYGMSWTYFQKLPQEMTRNFMPYSVCVDENNMIKAVPDDLRTIYTSFPASLWNWLEDHISNEESRDGEPGSFITKIKTILMK